MNKQNKRTNYVTGDANETKNRRPNLFNSNSIGIEHFVFLSEGVEFVVEFLFPKPDVVEALLQLLLHVGLSADACRFRLVG